MVRGEPIPLEEYFAGFDESRVLYEDVVVLLAEIGEFEQRVTRSQISFRRRLAFAWVWIPEKYLRRAAAPLVLTVDLRRHDPSPRWKQVVEPRPGRFTHHLELTSATQLDDEVRAWLREAWEQAL